MISGSRRSSLYRSIIGGKLATILVAPQQFGGLAVFCDTHDTQIGLGITVNILEILAGAGDDKNLTDDRSGIKAQRNRANHIVQIQVFPYFLGIQQVADVAAVALVPAEAVHSLHPRHLWTGSRVGNTA